ncbi:GntR family transcriptional regulator [Zooshikella harenae]|uniref:GntR family transcriptional regulator n=1 Tax=Zooshikella harenae TaxID=2827238 RepID=A0ABS5ZA16_9GAMM|nr:GntR family transcriptional regulator [Zooshikella harenae]MBU2710728.1 GntR family transcriptional regulator [Zooshikella harenae]
MDGIHKPADQLFENSKQTASARIFNELLQAILSGQLIPGSKINEAELAARHGCSRGPLREALQRLEGLHLILREAHVGARVVSLSDQQLTELYQIREVLEGLACRLAAQHMTERAKDELRRLLDTHRRYLEDGGHQKYYPQSGDLDFHYLLIRSSQNALLLRQLGDELYPLLQLYRRQFRDSGYQQPQLAFKEHLHIAEAIIEGDGELAEILMRKHIARARKRLKHILTT